MDYTNYFEYKFNEQVHNVAFVYVRLKLQTKKNENERDIEKVKKKKI